VPACGFSIGFERIVDLLSRQLARDAVAVLVEAEVPVADALAVAREMREASGRPGFLGSPGSPGASGSERVVETVRRSGKFGAQLKRLEAAGFGGFVVVRWRTALWCAANCECWAGSPARSAAGRPQRSWPAA